MRLDSIDIKILKENFDDYIIEQLNIDNASKIYSYLINNGIYYAKDIFISQVDLFLLDYNLFVEKFEKLKSRLGNDYVEILGEDCSNINIMYE